MSTTFMPRLKPRLSLSRIIEMNIGFLGLQFSFGLQQANMSPIYKYLGADESNLPFLQLAGPMTGLLIQPLIGALSDRTDSKWGRRTPYFLIGAILCSFGLFAMPYSSSLLMAASLLWMLDAGNNTTMEPYRAYVKDRLNDDQHEVGFLSQSAFTGLAQTLAFFAPSMLVYWFGMNKDAVDSHNIPQTTHVAFMIGAVLSISTIVWSIFRVRELPLTTDEKAYIAKQPKSFLSALKEIWQAILDMPMAMRQMAWMSLFQWYGMALFWNYAVISVSLSAYGTNNANTPGFHEAGLAYGQMGAVWNAIAFIAAVSMTPLTKRFGASRMHAFCLILAGLGILSLPHVGPAVDGGGPLNGFFRAIAMPELGAHPGLILSALGVGIGWASIMGNPYVILAGSIPPERTGVYMGIFNMFIVIPMLLISATLWMYYKPLLGGDARNLMTLSGILLILAAIAVLRVKSKPVESSVA